MSATDAKPTQAESSGTLTAEKVRELMEENSRQYPSPTDPYVWLTEYDWQAIADELNATLGDVPRLPHFWTHDGVLHIEATRMPTRIVVCEGGTCEFVPKRELDASEAENAKLRELVRDYIDAPCTTCDYWQDEFRCWNYDGADCGLVARARELGIEVDG